MVDMGNVPYEDGREFVVRMPEEGWFEAQAGHVANDYTDVTLHVVPFGGHELEFYAYSWDQKNCLMAVDLDSIDERFELPEGITVVGEVTHDPEFRHASLAKGQPVGGLIGLYSVIHKDFLAITFDDLKESKRARLADINRPVPMHTPGVYDVISEPKPKFHSLQGRSDLSERISAPDLRADSAQQERKESDKSIHPTKLIISADMSPNGEEVVMDFNTEALNRDSYYGHAYKDPFLTPTRKEPPIAPRHKGRSITSNNGGKSMIDVDFPTGSDSAGGDFSR